ncbi:hypothetical protein FOZ62_028171 [Perkinsus olseni]|uniref:Uncharacterized protein n=1 Tax=Perkinsus olseni TaxID=32597 RepID=A0A7J6QL54_PEROL|nr:hypothetical protein FOZ62_028171 [Perkinsus olseni]
MTVPREDYEGLKEYVRLLEQKLRRCAEEQERLERMHSREMRHRQKLYDEDLKKLRRLLYDESQREVKLNRSLLRLRQQWRGLIASIQNTRTVKRRSSFSWPWTCLRSTAPPTPRPTSPDVVIRSPTDSTLVPP